MRPNLADYHCRSDNCMHHRRQEDQRRRSSPYCNRSLPSSQNSSSSIRAVPLNLHVVQQGSHSLPQIHDGHQRTPVQALRVVSRDWLLPSILQNPHRHRCAESHRHIGQPGIGSCIRHDCSHCYRRPGCMSPGEDKRWCSRQSPGSSW